MPFFRVDLQILGANRKIFVEADDAEAARRAAETAVAENNLRTEATVSITPHRLNSVGYVVEAAEKEPNQVSRRTREAMLVAVLRLASEGGAE